MAGPLKYSTKKTARSIAELLILNCAGFTSAAAMIRLAQFLAGVSRLPDNDAIAVDFEIGFEQTERTDQGGSQQSG